MDESTEFTADNISGERGNLDRALLRSCDEDNVDIPVLSICLTGEAECPVVVILRFLDLLQCLFSVNVAL